MIERTTGVWLDLWISENERFKLQPNAATVEMINSNFIVNELFLNVSDDWYFQKLTGLFDNSTIENINEIHVWLRNNKDEFVWIKAKNGRQTVKSFYFLDLENVFRRRNEMFWNNLWKLEIHDPLNPTYEEWLRIAFPWIQLIGAVLMWYWIQRFKHLLGDCLYARIAWRVLNAFSYQLGW